MGQSSSLEGRRRSRVWFSAGSAAGSFLSLASFLFHPVAFACFRVVVIFQRPSPSVVSQSPSPPLPSSPQPPWKAVSLAHLRSIPYLAFEFWLIGVLIRLFSLRALPGGWGRGWGKIQTLGEGVHSSFGFPPTPSCPM